jgi:hypothetical protein
MIELFHNATSASYSKNLDQQRYDHLEAVCKSNLVNGEILEFGVYQGDTINFIAERFPNQLVYGFDSFKGLPEDWDTSYNDKFNKFKKGYFALDSLPSVNSNVKLIQGMFDSSLPQWLFKNEIKAVKLLHIDSDLYASAKIIFDNLNDYIVPGTVIVFDEFYPWSCKRYETWEEHEYKAFCEWVNEYHRKFEVLYRTTHQQCSVRITL